MVNETDLCWDNRMVSLHIESTHGTVPKYSDSKDLHGELDIPIGHSAHCVSSPGSYKLNTSSYHIFNPDTSSSSWLYGQRLQETHALILTGPENRVVSREVHNEVRKERCKVMVDDIYKTAEVKEEVCGEREIMHDPAPCDETQKKFE
jgi:hypothetical protein